jgi:hypothetical protein
MLEFELSPLDVDHAIPWLQSWCADEPQQQKEQRDTWDYLKQSLDEDRISGRKLFS